MRATDLPSFYTYNSVGVEDAAEGLDAAGLAAAADELQAGLAHRGQVEVEDVAAGERLRPGFEALGWLVERLAWMVLDGEPPGVGGDGVELGEVPFARTRPLREAWFGTSALAGSPAARSHFLGVEERVATRRGTRALAAWGPSGDPLGFVAFSVLRDAAEVEQVYVVPRRRGHGTGAALVRAAVAAAVGRRPGSSPTTRATRSGSTSGWASRPRGSSTCSRARRQADSQSSQPAPAGVVRRLAHDSAQRRRRRRRARPTPRDRRARRSRRGR